MATNRLGNQDSKVGFFALALFFPCRRLIQSLLLRELSCLRPQVRRRVGVLDLRVGPTRAHQGLSVLGRAGLKTRKNLSRELRFDLERVHVLGRRGAEHPRVLVAEMGRARARRETTPGRHRDPGPTSTAGLLADAAAFDATAGSAPSRP